MKSPKNLSVIGVLPARYGSTRFPGKPLTLIRGRPMIEWTILGVKTSKLIHRIIVATDHHEIAACAQQLGVEVAMTESDLASGTDRVCSAILDKGFADSDIILNIQGDEPLIQGEHIDQLTTALVQSPECVMGSLCSPFSKSAELMQDLESLDVVKVLLNQRSEAIYFSRFPIPHSRIQVDGSLPICYRHIGLYGFRKFFLEQFCSLPPTDLERCESLEQLRALYLGAHMKMVVVDHYAQGVDRPEDLRRIERILDERSC